jgi:RNA polymerase sigma-70 factor (ECF subfamily)
VSELDQARFQAWCAGDRAAGHALVEAYYDSMAGFFRAKAGPRSEDLVQRTFLGCLEARERYRGAASFRSFLFGIARNVLLEFVRARTRDASVDGEFTLGSLHDLDPGLSTVVRGRDEHRLLAEALKRIPLDLQLTLELFYWEELSVDDVAAVLEIPPGTVKSRLHRAKGLLRDQIATLDPAPELARSTAADLDHWARSIRRFLGRGGSPSA